MGFDLSETLRSLKPQKYPGTLERRADDDLPWVAEEPAIGGPVFLDTSVYLDVLQGRSPVEVDTLLAYRRCHHSAVCLSELTHAFGRIDPKHASTKAVLETTKATIDDIADHRTCPGGSDLGTGWCVGWLALPAEQSAQRGGHERRLVNDALVFLQARQLGASVLTGNVRDLISLPRFCRPGGSSSIELRRDRGHHHHHGRLSCRYSPRAGTAGADTDDCRHCPVVVKRSVPVWAQVAMSATTCTTTTAIANARVCLRARKIVC